MTSSRSWTGVHCSDAAAAVGSITIMPRRQDADHDAKRHATYVDARFFAATVAAEAVGALLQSHDVMQIRH